MQLSIIVCVYNSSKYLAECLCSICKQLESQHELIIINDNSSDNSESIISSFSDAHHNIVSISNNNNIGAGASRNIGLKHARGKYITFIDSDDYIGEGYFTSLINDIETNKTEIVFSDYKYIDKDSHFHQASVFTQNNKVIWRKMVASAWTAPWAKLYRSDFIHKYNLHFNTQSSIGEDIQFSWLSYLYCKKAMISDHACYYYRQNQNGCDHITDERVFGIIKALNTTKKIYKSCYAAETHDDLLLHLLIKHLSYNANKLVSTIDTQKFINDSTFLLEDFDSIHIENNRYLTKLEKHFYELYINN